MTITCSHRRLTLTSRAASTWVPTKQRPRYLFGGIAALVCSMAMQGTAAAQPTLSVSADVVTPGTSVEATITGPPGRFYALLGSSVGPGLSHGGVALGVGLDVASLPASGGAWTRSPTRR